MSTFIEQRFVFENGLQDKVNAGEQGEGSYYSSSKRKRTNYQFFNILPIIAVFSLPLKTTLTEPGA